MAKAKPGKKKQAAPSSRAKAPAAAPRKAAPAGSRKPAPQMSWTNTVNEITAKYKETIPKNIDKGLGAVRKELRQARQPIYALNRKIKNAPSKHYKTKYRKEKAALEATLIPRLTDLSERREDFKTLQRAQDAIRVEKATTRRELKRLKKQLTKADEELDYQAQQKLVPQIIKLQGNIDAMDAALGIAIQRTDTTGYQPSEEEDRRGYIEDPNNPYTIWQAMKQLDEDLKNAVWKHFVINGKYFSSDSQISILQEASSFWLTLKKPRTDTPKVNRYVHLQKFTVKYVPFHG